MIFFAFSVNINMIRWKCMTAIWRAKISSMITLCGWLKWLQTLLGLGMKFLFENVLFLAWFKFNISCSHIYFVSNPSIEGDTPFVSIKSSDEVYCQEMSNAPTTSVTANIKEQVHYNTWRAVEAIYKSLNVL